VGHKLSGADAHKERDTLRKFADDLVLEEYLKASYSNILRPYILVSEGLI
jgi:hypothetical protein